MNKIEKVVGALAVMVLLSMATIKTRQLVDEVTDVKKAHVERDSLLDLQYQIQKKKDSIDLVIRAAIQHELEFWRRSCRECDEQMRQKRKAGN